LCSRTHCANVRGGDYVLLGGVIERNVLADSVNRRQVFVGRGQQAADIGARRPFSRFGKDTRFSL
jgi:tRNA G37 N-methylase TrmD